MALFRCEGMNQLEKMFKELSTLDQGRAAEDMLNAGKVEVEKAWKKVIDKRGLKRSKLMQNTVKSTKPKHNVYGTFLSTYPWGVEKDPETGKPRVRNAEKAFYLHYGFVNHRTGRFYGDHVGWVDDVEKEAMDKATAVMEKIYENYLKTKG